MRNGAGKGKNGAREGKEKKTERNRTLIWLWFHSFGTELTKLGEVVDTHDWICRLLFKVVQVIQVILQF